MANITAEVLKTDIRFVKDWLYQLFYKIWNAETISEDWSRGLIAKSLRSRTGNSALTGMECSCFWYQARSSVIYHPHETERCDRCH